MNRTITRSQWLKLYGIMRRNGANMSFREAEDDLASKALIAERIKRLAEDGKIAIVYGGMDCDGARWDNRVAIMPAVLVVVLHWIDTYHEHAEGPQWQRIESPSRAPKRSTTRDLALEAFENGHSHVLYV